MMYQVYILISEKTKRFYIGQTRQLSQRMIRHNEGREKYTQAGVPWILLWCTEKPTRGEAIKLEAKLKNLSRARLVEFMLKYQQDIAGTDELLLIKQLSAC